MYKLGRILGTVLAVTLMAASPCQAPEPEARTQPYVRSVLVLSLRSATQAQRCSNATLLAEVFTDANSVQAYFEENSYGRASISGMVSGPYTIAPGNTCDRNGWADQADAAAMAAGVNVNEYESTVYVLPPESMAVGCTPGTSNFRGFPRGKRITIREDGCDSRFDIAHELGHGFGSGHSGIAPTYVSRPVPDARQTVARQLMYGDLSSVMGGTFDGLVDEETWRAMFNVTPHFTAPQKIYLGWLPARNVQTVTVGGSYTLSLLEARRTDFQALKVIAASSTYYLSYRRAVGFDSSLLRKYADKTSVHTFDVDVPGEYASNVSTLHASLGDRQSFSDGQFTVTQVRHDATYAYLTISFP